LIRKQTLLIKYGGNAMTDIPLKSKVLQVVAKIAETGCNVVIVHGGGPFIKQALQSAKIESEFIDGHRVTSEDAFQQVEMALLGRVNANLVRLLNTGGAKAIGLSGYDGGMVHAQKRKYYSVINGSRQLIDLGLVGDVANVNPELIHLLLERNFMPVISCIAADTAGIGYNINADMFAGHLAGALNADQFIILTDVDGVFRDFSNPDSLISKLRIAELDELYSNKVIQGGMIPKLESCSIALRKGAGKARIINGTKPEQLLAVTEQQPVGTCIEA